MRKRSVRSRRSSRAPDTSASKRSGGRDRRTVSTIRRGPAELRENVAARPGAPAELELAVADVARSRRAPRRRSAAGFPPTWSARFPAEFGSPGAVLHTLVVRKEAELPLEARELAQEQDGEVAAEVDHGIGSDSWMSRTTSPATRQRSSLIKPSRRRRDPNAARGAPGRARLSGTPRRSGTPPGGFTPSRAPTDRRTRRPRRGPRPGSRRRRSA